MKRKTLVKILAGIVLFIILIQLAAVLFLEPWVKKKILAALNKADSDYEIKMEEVNTLFLVRGIEFKTVTMHSNSSRYGLNGEMESIKFKGINLAKLVFKNDLDVNEVIISNSRVNGKISLSKAKHIVSTLNINIKKISFDKANMAIQNASDSKSYLVKEAFISLYNFEIAKTDTLFLGDTKMFDFKAAEVALVSPDSVYTFKLNDVSYSESSNELRISKFSIQPSYKDYDFTSRHEFQTDCIEAELNNIAAHHFSLADYFKSNDLISSLVEIENMDMNVFRDRRRKFRHVEKPMLQEVFYRYRGRINIDSVHLANGNIKYTEHAENSKEPGSIMFKEVNAKIYNATNDTVYKAKDAYTILKTEARLMGKAKITISLKAKLLDSRNVFWVNGGLSSIQASDLNSMLERNAFIHAKSGKVDTMYFNFTANNTTSTGELTLLYNGLDFKPEGQYADAPSSVLQVIISSITGIRVDSSNPLLGEEVRKGAIDYERDPEKFIFNYVFKSILSGIKSSIAKNSKAKVKS